jgi:hypothetical protein
MDGFLGLHLAHVGGDGLAARAAFEHRTLGAVDVDGRIFPGVVDAQDFGAAAAAGAPTGSGEGDAAIVRRVR